MTGVTKNTVVSLRFIMRNSHGDVLENNMQSPPVNYLHGGVAIMPALQRQLEGLVPGDKKIVELSARDGSPGDFTFDVIIDNVREALKEEIILGYPVVIDENVCDEDCSCHEERKNHTE